MYYPYREEQPQHLHRLKLHKMASGYSCIKSGSFTNTANADAITTISGLNIGTAYTLYVVAQDNPGNLQNTVANG